MTRTALQTGQQSTLKDAHGETSTLWATSVKASLLARLYSISSLASLATMICTYLSRLSATIAGHESIWPKRLITSGTNASAPDLLVLSLYQIENPTNLSKVLGLLKKALCVKSFTLKTPTSGVCLNTNVLG